MGTLVKSLELREKILLNFKRLWCEEYLLCLKESYKNLFDSNFCNKGKEGDIVLIKNPAETRQHWILGRIIELYPGPDGKVRNVKLLRGDVDWDKKGGLRPELHSLQHLYSMELSITHPHTSPIPQSPEFEALCEREAEPEQVSSDAQPHLEPTDMYHPLDEEIAEDDNPEPEVEDSTE